MRPGAWSDALVIGATDVVPPVLDWPAKRMDPVAIALATIEEVGTSLRAADRRRTLVWIHINLDEYIHRRGYDPAVAAAVRRLGEAAAAWADAGSVVLLHSDHGQIRNRCPPRLAAAWRRVETPEFCDGPAGGAGRIRWLYCRDNMVGAVRAILEDACGDGLVVRHRDEVPAFAGAPPLTVGSVVAIATGSDFPVPDLAYIFEHGGLAEAEMVAPLAVWYARLAG